MFVNLYGMAPRTVTGGAIDRLMRPDEGKQRLFLFLWFAPKAAEFVVLCRHLYEEIVFSI